MYLEPCPVCYSDDVSIEIEYQDCYRDLYYVMCGSCGIRLGAFGLTEEEAANDWNNLPRRFVTGKNWE